MPDYSFLATILSIVAPILVYYANLLKNNMNFSRANSKSLITKIILIFIVITFIAWGIKDGLDGKGSSNWAIKVGSFEYSYQEWQRLLSYEMQKEQNIAQPVAETVNENFVKARLIEQLINHALLLQEAEKLGFLVSDDTVRREIYNMDIFKGEDGKFDEKLFDKTIKNNGFTEISFIQKIKEENLRNQVLQIFMSNGNVIAPQLVEALIQTAYSKKIFKVYRFYPNKLNIISKIPSDTDLETFFHQNKEQFTIPEKREISYFTFGIDNIPDSSIVIDDEELKQQYDKKLSIFIEPERREVKQIIVSNKEEAINVIKEINQGLDFDLAIKKYSSNKLKSNLGLVTADGFEKHIADAIFNIGINSISDPIQSPLGWHIFKVIKIYPENTKSFDSVKAQLLSQLKEEKLFESLTELANNIENDINNDTESSLSILADKYGFKIKIINALQKINNDSANQGDETIIGNKKFIDTAFSTELHSLSTVTPIPDSSNFYVLRVDNITPEKLEDFSDIKEKLTFLWQKNRKEALYLSIVQKKLEMLKSKHLDEQKNNDEIMEYVNSLTVKSEIVELAYNIEPPKDFTLPLIKESINLKLGEFSNIYASDKDSYICINLENIIFLNEKELSEYRLRFSDKIAEIYYDITLQEYLASLRKLYKVDINKNIIH